MEGKSPFFDLNKDDLVNDDDHAAWIEDIFGTWLGDVDLNKEVGFSDFLIVSANFGSSGGWAEGDIDSTGDVPVV